MKPKKDMLRIVKNAEGEIKTDYSGKASGRGAYICNSEACILKLKKQKLLNKTFSAPVSDEVYAGIEEEFFGKR
jgi:hypothetical protein